MRNYDVAKKRRDVDSLSTPGDTTLLPIFSDPLPAERDDQNRAKNALDILSDDSDEGLGNHRRGVDEVGDFEESSVKTTSVRAATKESPVSLTCGVMPSGTGLHDFHVPPRKIHARSSENIYWLGFETQMSNVLATEKDDTEVLEAVAHPWGITASSALTALANQQKNSRLWTNTTQPKRPP